MADSIGYTNQLINSTSPYLLQHAHNPVNWEPWSDDAFQRAQAEDKLVIVSIGYSSCHWCHVMEHESFENAEVAELMNKNYVCIKVDREDRPDIDHYYIEAAHLMQAHAGWPLNAFALPNKKPVFVGTYFPKVQWMSLLGDLTDGYHKNKQHFEAYADKVEQGIVSMNLVPDPAQQAAFTKESLEKCYQGFAALADKENGGLGNAPKFPMPDDIKFLLRYWFLNKNEDAKNQALLTLDKMARGGIYDQIGGGFARYSVDAHWKVPHFEKMLYDNGQLVGLYSQAYKITGSELYKQIVYDSIGFIEREMTSPEGGFYSGLDADSEGVEGKFYVWTESDFDRLFPDNKDLIKQYFGIGKEGYWENENNVLLMAKTPAELAQSAGKTEDEVKSILAAAKQTLLQERSKRVRPGLDDKVLLNWNALMISGLIEAYNAFGEQQFLKMASKCLRFIGDEMKDGLNLLHSWRKGEAAIPAFLDDYALYIQALIGYYQATFSDVALQEASWLIEKVIDDFSDPNGVLFYFTSKSDTDLGVRKLDTQDNVIASGNSVMARNLFYLGAFYGKPEYMERAQKMLALMAENIEKHGSFYANWAMLLCDIVRDFKEVAILGSEVANYRKAIEKLYIPNKIIAGNSDGNVSIPLLENRYKEGKTLVYICENNTCLRPMETVEEAIKEL
jgi:hypothetical protein